MSKFALVEESGRVAQVEAGVPFAVAEPLAWRPCPDGVRAGDRWDGSKFVEVSRAPKTPTAADCYAERDRLLAVAALRVAPLQDAVDLNDATAAEKAKLAAWRAYRVALNRVDQQPGFPAAVNWPAPPASD